AELPGLARAKSELQPNGSRGCQGRLFPGGEGWEVRHRDRLHHAQVETGKRSAPRRASGVGDASSDADPARPDNRAPGPHARSGLMRIGLLDGGQRERRPATLDEHVERARLAEDVGLASVWFSNIYGHDAMTAAALAARVTTRIELGTAITPTYPRHPHAIARRLAAGTITWMVGARTLRDHIVPRVRDAAAQAGRPAPRIVVELPLALTGDVAAARELARRMFKTYASLPAYRAMLDREGAAGPAEVAVVGDHDAIGEQLLRLAEAGATDFNAAPFSLGEHDAGLDACLRSLARIGAEIGGEVSRAR